MSKIVGELDGIKIYLFGSSLTKESPSDIDLLIVYNDETFNINSILEFRIWVKEQLANALNMDIDILLLSDKEISTNSFIEDEGAVKI